MSGLKLAALYGFYPHQLGLCGPANEFSKKTLYSFLKGKKVSLSSVEGILSQFKGAFSYYQLIAKSNRIKNPFDKRVVKAYWIGNSLLEKVNGAELLSMITEQTLKKIRISPQLLKAHHNFHVLVVGSFSDKISSSLRSIELCRVSWGRVVKISQNNKVIVEVKPLELKGKKFVLGKEVLRSVRQDPFLTPRLDLEQIVSIHWGHVIQILNKKELQQLEKYTRLSMEVASMIG